MKERWYIIIVAIIVIGLMVAIAVPSFVKARNTSSQNSCVNNMRLIDAGKEQWAMTADKEIGDTCDVSACNEYIKGQTTPICPAGGTYTYGVVGGDPSCSYADEPNVKDPGAHRFRG